GSISAELLAGQQASRTISSRTNSSDPARLNVTATGVPRGPHVARSTMELEEDDAAKPPASTTVSPGQIPARRAGLPGSTWITTAAPGARSRYRPIVATSVGPPFTGRTQFRGSDACNIP